MRSTRPDRWNDPEAEPDLHTVLHERGPRPTLAELERLVMLACDAHDIDPGPVVQRLTALREAGLQRQAEADARSHGRGPRQPLSEVAADVLDSLTGCELTVRQLCEDTGRPEGTIANALTRLRLRRLVSRERRGGVWTYRATAYGRRASGGGR